MVTKEKDGTFLPARRITCLPGKGVDQLSKAYRENRETG